MKLRQRSTKLKTDGSSSKTSSCSPLVVRVVTEAGEVGAFDRRLADQHYLGSTRPVGDFLRQVVERDGKPVAQLAWGSAALKLKDREAWIGWTVAQRAERLKLVVQNRRYLLLHDKGAEPNLASQALAAACRVLPQHGRKFGRCIWRRTRSRAAWRRPAGCCRWLPISAARCWKSCVDRPTRAGATRASAWVRC